jgi:hypothetical protein
MRWWKRAIGSAPEGKTVAPVTTAGAKLPVDTHVSPWAASPGNVDLLPQADKDGEPCHQVSNLATGLFQLEGDVEARVWAFLGSPFSGRGSPVLRFLAGDPE